MKSRSASIRSASALATMLLAGVLEGSACGDDGSSAALPDDDGTTGVEPSTSSNDTGSDGMQPLVLDLGSSSVDGSSSTGDAPPLSCERIPGAPPTIVLKGHALVGVDVETVEAALTFDPGTQSAVGRATVEFTMGPDDGFPILDLRQEVTSIVLDGEPLADSAFLAFDGGAGAASSMQAVTRELPRCSAHTLELEYALSDHEYAPYPEWAPDAVRWRSAMTDLVPGYFLELWIPANLQHDLFELATEIAVTGTDRQHALVTNGAAEEIGTNAWRVTFEPPVNASSPLWALLPADTLDARATPIRLPDGHTVTVESYAELAPGEPDADLELVEAMVSSALHETNLELGDYLHGDRIVVFASHGGMEYDGATFAFPSDFVLRHEVFHSWIGRGLRPLTGRDAWFDEAWTSFAMDWNYAYETVLGPTDRPPPALAPDTPWLRATPTAAYSRGAAVLHTIASEVGISELRGLLREFYVSGTADAFVTTEQLELFLWCNTSGPIVRTTFHNHVYGKAGEPSPLDPADCG